MFRWLLDKPTTLYGFLSGIFISVATTALSNFALSADMPSNLGRLIRAALIAFVAASAWFWLGEYVVLLRERVRGNQDGIAGDRAEAYLKAAELVEKDEGWRLYLLLAVAIVCSLLWALI